MYIYIYVYTPFCFFVLLRRRKTSSRQNPRNERGDHAYTVIYLIYKYIYDLAAAVPIERAIFHFSLLLPRRKTSWSRSRRNARGDNVDTVIDLIYTYRVNPNIYMSG